MDLTAKNIFAPGRSIDVVFNINSLSPISRPSMIFDSDESKKEIIISQTKPPIRQATTYETMHITALHSEPLKEKTRLGIECKIKALLDNYELNKDNHEQAIVLSYKDKLEQVNIRSAFRIKPNNEYSIAARFIFKDQELFSGKHFKIFDISISGIGILIPNTKEFRTSPLFHAELGDKGKMGLIMKEPGEEGESPEIKKIFNKIKIVRMNRKFNQKFTLIGCKFASWDSKHEDELSNFVHKLQLFEIRHFQKY